MKREVFFIKILEKVIIGYKEFKVNKKEGDIIADNKVCYGNIVYDKGEINLSIDYSEDQQKCIFMHEVIHGIDDIFEIDLTEDQVRRLGKGMYLFIKDNPSMFISDNSVSNKLNATVNIDTDKIINKIEEYIKNGLSST